MNKNQNLIQRGLFFLSQSELEPVFLDKCKYQTFVLDTLVHLLHPSNVLCFRVVENDLFKQDWRSRKKKQIFQYIVLKWTLVLLIGLLTGLVGFFNNLAVENIAGFKLLLTGNLMLKER